MDKAMMAAVQVRERTHAKTYNRRLSSSFSIEGNIRVGTRMLTKRDFSRHSQIKSCAMPWGIQGGEDSSLSVLSFSPK